MNALASRLNAPGRLAVPMLMTLVGVIATFWIVRLVREIDLQAVLDALAGLPGWRIAAAIACTTLSHLLLTLYDVIALRAVGARVPWRTAARAAFTSYTLSHNLGFAALTGGAARLRIYGEAGLTPGTVARIVVIAGIAFWTGVASVAALSLLTLAKPVTLAGIALTPSAARSAGATFLALLAAAIVAVKAHPGGKWSIPIPRASLAVPLIAVAALDLAFASIALFVLLPALPVSDYPGLYLVYALAIIAGLVTHVPGGVGVFEAIVLAALPSGGPAEIAALIAYRLIYYMLPLGAALALNAVIEARSFGRRLQPLTRMLGAVGDEIGPFLLGVMTFGGGLVLLLSGALPALHPRLRLLRQVLSLPFIEGSHVLASLVGAGLLLVAPALTNRLDSGMRAARTLFLLGAVFSLAKGLDFEEAGMMLVMAGLLQLAAPSFYRTARGPFSVDSRGWLIAAVIGFAMSAASGMMVYRHLPYDTELWWRFCLRADAPRFLRATFAAGALIAGFAVRQAFWHTQRMEGVPSLPEGVFARASAVSPRSDASLALTGDKRFLVSPEGDAFLMYRDHGSSCVVMGDPVGARERWRDLVWELRRLADRNGVRLCFYQISTAMLPLIVELGLKPMKYGEEAHVPSAAFSLSGSRMKSLRNSHARAQREGLHFEIIEERDVPDWLERLRPISDRWLKHHGGTEKAFSLGGFEPAYLSCFDLAIVRQGGYPIAFANIWRSGDGSELSVDLMRQCPDAPPGTMDFLMIELLQYASRTGSSRFNLGMAPLSGMRGGKLAPTWTRIANLAFSVGGWRYNFAGLRHYKEKFAPDWESRYVATGGGLAGLRSMVDLVRLIAN